MKMGGSTSFMVSTDPSPNCLIKQDGENEKRGDQAFFYISMLWKGQLIKIKMSIQGN